VPAPRPDPPSPYPDAPRPEMLAFIPPQAARVLDVGCHTGAFGARLKQRGCEVWGVEMNPATAAIARQRLDRVHGGAFDADADIPAHHFDVVVFNDVLEHFADPWQALALARCKLRPQGVIVASVPNFRHLDNLVHVLWDRDFRYEPTGIRDRTHLRFFTRKSAVRLFQDSGLQVLRAEGINRDWWQPGRLRRLACRLVVGVADDTRYLQFAIVARPNQTPVA